MSFKKKFLILCLACILFFVWSISCMAAPSDCKLTVKLYDENKQGLDGIYVSICKVADINGTDYIPTEAFIDSGISIVGLVKNPSADTANAVYQYVKQHQIESMSACSQNGEVVFESLDRAIWLVFCQEEQEYRFNPYLVFLPQTINGKVQCEVIAEPKVEQNITEAEPVIPNTNQTGDKLPQTGQLWWPILMLAIAGVAFVALGIMELRNRKNEKR